MFAGRIRHYGQLSQGFSNRKAGLLVESIDSLESVKANSAEWNLQGRFSKIVAEGGHAELRIRHYSAISTQVTVLLQQAGYVGIVAAGAWMVIENQMTMGALIACSIISGRALAPVAQLPSIIVQLGNARAAGDGLDQLLRLPSELDDQDTMLTPEKLDASLTLERVRFRYGLAGPTGQAAIEVNGLQIHPGERVGIIGTVGSGKSTLLKLAAGLYRPAEGRVLLGGVEMGLIDPKLVRAQIAYLPQEIRLLSGSLRENLIIGLPDPGDEAILNAARRTGLIELITRHSRGLALPITEGGRGISGGQRQLIGLTRVILAHPSIYILDEPTSSMDAGTEMRIVHLLNELAAGGATLIIATHKSALLPILEHVLVVQNGQVTIDGPRDRVLAHLAGQPPQSHQGGAAVPTRRSEETPHGG
ncbi:MAG: ATP-binding cassette domain-containing protein, partial [Magnetococcales bacterium]|nr:ATP-binding cassette domain-containing protein [Magnetococcales bacterium]